MTSGASFFGHAADGVPAAAGAAAGADAFDDLRPRSVAALEREAVRGRERLQRRAGRQRAVVVQTALQRLIDGHGTAGPPTLPRPGGAVRAETGERQRLRPAAAHSRADLILAEQLQPAAVAMAGAVGGQQRGALAPVLAGGRSVAAEPRGDNAEAVYGLGDGARALRIGAPASHPHRLVGIGERAIEHLRPRNAEAADDLRRGRQPRVPGAVASGVKAHPRDRARIRAGGRMRDLSDGGQQCPIGVG